MHNYCVFGFQSGIRVIFLLLFNDPSADITLLLQQCWGSSSGFKNLNCKSGDVDKVSDRVSRCFFSAEGILILYNSS